MEVNVSLSVEIDVEVSRLIKYPKAITLNLGSRGQSSIPVR